MTREEAIKLVDDRMCFGRGKWSDHHIPERDIYWEAGEMAIKALEQPEIIYCKDCRYCIYTPEAPNEHRPNETYPELWHCCFHKVYMPYMSLVQPDGYCNNAKKRKNKG